mmetsp:Transcript_31407/g.73917  ORF Transcript_31407/g.73917 Transcript_31407/m.73917 type:complete len:207 (-) Transcript_31407:418-1038(-)
MSKNSWEAGSLSRTGPSMQSRVLRKVCRIASCSCRWTFIPSVWMVNFQGRSVSLQMDGHTCFFWKDSSWWWWLLSLLPSWSHLSVRSAQSSRLTDEYPHNSTTDLTRVHLYSTSAMERESDDTAVVVAEILGSKRLLRRWSSGLCSNPDQRPAVLLGNDKMQKARFCATTVGLSEHVGLSGTGRATSRQSVSSSSLSSLRVPSRMP